MISETTSAKADYIKKINVKKLVITIFTFIMAILEYITYDHLGIASGWGPAHYINFIVYTLSNIQVFFILTIIGTFLIGLSCFDIFRNEQKETVINKKLQLVGLILYFLGILFYFDLLFFEPFLLLYLFIVAFIYYFIVSGFNFNIFGFTYHFRTPFYQPNYKGYELFNEMTIWNKNTQHFVFTDFYLHQTFDVYLIALLILFILQLIFFSTEKERLLSEKFINKLEIAFKRNFQFKITSTKKIIIALIYLVIQYALFSVYALDKSFLITFLLFIVIIPLFKKSIVNLSLITKKYLTLKIYDIYVLNFILMMFITTLLGFDLKIAEDLIVFSISIWLSIKIINSDLIKKFRKISEYQEPSNFTIDLTNVVSATYLIIIILYISAWMTTINESIFFVLAFYATLLRFGPFIIENFLNKRVIKYSIRRVLLLFPTLAGISIIIFGIMSSVGSPVTVMTLGLRCPRTEPHCLPIVRAQLEAALGLNAPIQIQWTNWIFHFIQGDFGREITLGSSPVALSISGRIVPTLEITLLPTILAFLISIRLGILAYEKIHTIIDELILIFTSIAVAVPIFVFLFFFLVLFNGMLQLTPHSGRITTNIIGVQGWAYYKWFYSGIPLSFTINLHGITYTLALPTFYVSEIISWAKWDWLSHAFIPILAVTLGGLAMYTRLIRATLNETMNKEYILNARVYGFSEKSILNQGLRNSLFPLITLLGITLSAILAFAPITEEIMKWPGIGIYFYSSIIASDYSVLMGTTMVVALLMLLSNLMTDVFYSIIDPSLDIN